MAIRVVLVDVNPRMVQAWREVFESEPEVDIFQGSMLDQEVDAWVTPTNARGSMDGGLDAVIKKHLGAAIQTRVQQAIAQRYRGNMGVGHSVCVETGRALPRYLISTTTMTWSSQDISDTLNVALACSAAFQQVHLQNARPGGSVRSVALPGLGASTGRVPVEVCADLMWTAYNLFREHVFADFGAMRAALEAELGALGNVGTAGTSVAPAVKGAMYGKPASAACPPALATKLLDDLDDYG